jgi:hypothetical protein
MDLPQGRTLLHLDLGECVNHENSIISVKYHKNFNRKCKPAFLQTWNIQPKMILTDHNDRNGIKNIVTMS